MGFVVAPALLLGLGLLGAILATYLLRPRRPVRRISSTFLWLAALNDVEAAKPWRRVPPSMLLFLQLLTAAAIAIALARPFTLSTESSGPYSIVLVDASASMQATDVQPGRFEQAKQRASQLIDGLESGQSLGLVSLDAEPHVVAPPTSDRAALHRALDTLTVSSQKANLPAALSIAGTLVEGHSDAQITVIGDGSIDRAQVPANLPTPVRFLGIGRANAANLAVAGIGTRTNAGQLSALARVVNYGPQTQTATLTLRVDGTRFDARSLTIDPGKSADAEWDDLPPAARTLEARLDQPDALALDNAAWAVLGADRPTRVLLVSDGNVFVERALGLRPSTQVTRVSPADYTQQSQAYDLIVLDGFVPPVLPTGSSVLLIHPPPGNGIIGAGPDLSISQVSPARDQDPLVRDVPLSAVHISRSRQLQPVPWADVVVQSPETPLVLVGEQAGRRLGVIGFDVHQSDLPLQPGFPVLVQHLLDWLVPTSSTATPVVQVGDSVALAPLPEATSVDVVTPDQRRISVAPPLPPAPFTGTDQPGLYQVVQRDAAGRETTTSFAANFSDAGESRLAPATDSGAPPVGPRKEPFKAPHEFWEAFAVLALALLGIEAGLAWWQFTAATVRARAALALRVLGAVALVLALIGVGLPQRVDRQAVVFVNDVSASVADSQADASRFVGDAISARKPDDAYAMVDAARGAAISQGLTRSDPSPPQNTQLPTDATNLADGLRLAADLLPTGFRPRVVLLSDGQETSGDAVSQARLLQSRGVEVDVVPLASARGPEALVDSVSAPNVVHEGERFSVGVRIVSNTATDATVHVTVNGQPLADQSVSLPVGTTNLSFGAQASDAGLLDVRATLDAANDTEQQNNQARSVVEVQGPPRVLIVEQRDGEGATIASALQSTGMRIETVPVAAMPDQLEALGNYAAVVLADVSADSLTDTQQTTLRSYVRDLGRGLLAIGGDTSFGQGQYIGTPLDDALPVRSSVRSHRDQGRVALLLVVDQSGSMGDDVYNEGTTKLDMARQAAVLSTQELGPRDLVGILTFESFRHWVLPMMPVLGLSPTAIQDKLAPLTADGGTDIFPALTDAYNAVKDTDARYRHIILLTDGQSCCAGDYPGLLDKLRAANVTLSTIAIGGDADQQLLAQLARQGDGRYYFAEHARDIPRLMTRETELATRGPVVEGTITPRPVSPDAGLASIAAGGLPQLGGYLVTTPKDLAEVLLVSDAADPILARWQYGLGRATAWTSDLRGRWSQDWLQWPGTAQLFSQMVGWTIAPTQGPLQVSVRADAEQGHVSVDDAQPNDAASSAVVQAQVAQPNGDPLTVDLTATRPGHYEGSFPLAGPGSYIVHVQEQRDGTTTGTADAGLPVSYAAEFRQVTADQRRLEQIARAGGGHVLITPAAAFADDLPPVTTPLPLQASLLLLAAVLLVVDVALRRVRVSLVDVWDWLRHPHRVALEAPWRAGEGWQPAAWMPGAWAPRRPPPRVTQPLRSEHYGGHATPGLARAEKQDDAEESALSATRKWLAAHRSTTGDKG